MSAGSMGLVAVVDADDRLHGIFTDGDLRRLIERGEDPRKASLAQHASEKPVVIGRDEPATKALRLMESRHITALLVTDAQDCLEGVVHIHDLWRLQMF